MASHKARFTWGVGPQHVFVAGGFNNWSGDASPLEKQADGTFAGEFDVPWGEKQAFKYVVDGEWKVREDEAKEWDAAGNMNNVYTAPHKPEIASEPASAAAVVPTAAATTATTEPKTESHAPETLLASSAPGAAGTSEAPLGAAPVTTSQPSTATAAVPITAAPSTTESTPVQIEKTAANANVGASSATTADHHDRFMSDEAKEVLEKAAEIGAGALAALGAAVGSAVVAAEKAIGVDVTHSQPLSLEEAKAQGIDVNALEQREAPTDAVSPVGSKPSASGIADLEEKAKELKLESNGTSTGTSVPLPASETKSETTTKNDIPAQDETFDNHKTIPAPEIYAVAAPDPSKDRSLNGSALGTNTDTAGTKPISNDPAVSAVEAKKDAEEHAAGTGSTAEAAQGKVTETPSPTAVPSSGGLTSEVVAAGAAVSQNAGATGTTLANAHPVDSTATGTTTTATGAATSAPAAATTPVAPTTPAKKTPTTAASTPAKSTSSTPVKDADGRKRKPSFFKKMKEAFSSPKDKEKK